MEYFIPLLILNPQNTVFILHLQHTSVWTSHILSTQEPHVSLVPHEECTGREATAGR